MASTPQTDAEIAQRVAAGDTAVFTALMRKHNRALFRTARSILRDDADAEDALQDGYLAAYRAMHTFRGDARLSTWLVRIVANEALARLRKRVRLAEVIPIEPGSHDGAAAERVAADAAAEPERAAVSTQTLRLIEARIDDLPDAFRTVFVLRALEEMSVEEVAASLAIPEATVRTRFFRARAMLRESLARELDLAMDDAFAFDGERCDRIVAGVLERLAQTKGETP
ncbi:RNA polymerase sigma factor [Usitatibacter palustris]|nr:RNA polymerase sigma factor [Usitatibacter palustris]